MTFPKLHTRGNIPMNSSCVYVCVIFFFCFLFVSVCIDPVLSYVAKDCILTCLVSVAFCIDIHLLYNPAGFYIYAAFSDRTYRSIKFS